MNTIEHLYLLSSQHPYYKNMDGDINAVLEHFDIDVNKYVLEWGYNEKVDIDEMDNSIEVLSYGGL